jgi:hypothetical protein
VEVLALEFGHWWVVVVSALSQSRGFIVARVVIA